MNYKETLHYMFTHLPMYQRIGEAAYKKDLTNTIAICNRLRNPQNNFKTIHLAGTNGKGSCSHMLCAILQEHGYKVGLYVSPHYKDFRERIKVNGKYISQKHVIEFIEKNKYFFEEQKPSFFEMTVGMAFDYFNFQKVDIAVIETGLGGRLDSTNVINPILSIITNISYDHMNMLGNTLPLIAAEKAGIIKPKTPALIGEHHDETDLVFINKSTEVNAELIFAQDIIQNVQYHYDYQSGIYQYNMEGKSHKIKTDIIGPYQKNNITTVLAASHLLKNSLNLDQQKIVTAFSKVKILTNFIGRWQILNPKPLIIADSAHNKSGLMSTFEAINNIEREKLHIITGFVNDKDIESVISIFPEDAKYYFGKANIPRGLDAAILKSKFGENNKIGRKYSTIKNALQAAKRNATENDLILIVGSIFVVAEVL